MYKLIYKQLIYKWVASWKQFWVELDLPSKIFETDISIFTKCTLNVFLTC